MTRTEGVLRAATGFLLVAALLGAGGAAWLLVSSRSRDRVAPAQPARQPVQLQMTAERGNKFGGRVPGPVLRVRAGQRVYLTFENRDQVAHDIRIVGADERPPYLEPVFPRATTGLLGPGQRETMVFTPTQPGRYRYVCTVPGHDATMFGEFIVE
ncbi:MAG: cupredoxin domain-containing protein [Armatimonadota bacterium]|nr:cupredoxin domain-containing protein [Armatimonadota bacterium]